jgi:hypothetical protein
VCVCVTVFPFITSAVVALTIRWPCLIMSPFRLFDLLSSFPLRTDSRSEYTHTHTTRILIFHL